MQQFSYFHQFHYSANSTKYTTLFFLLNLPPLQLTSSFVNFTIELVISFALELIIFAHKLVGNKINSCRKHKNKM